MEYTKLEAAPRQHLGKGPSRRLRMEKKIPSVLYGFGKCESIILDPKVVTHHLLQEGGKNRIFLVSGQGITDRHAIVREYQVDPVSRDLLHVDLQEIDVNKKIQVTVALNFTGRAAGVVDGGVLNVVERNVRLECLPTQIPKHIDVDVTALKIGDSLHIEDMQAPDGTRLVFHENITLVTVVPPAKEEEVAPVLEAAAEPEVISEKKAEERAEAKAEEGKGEAKKAEPKKKE